MNSYNKDKPQCKWVYIFKLQKQIMGIDNYQRKTLSAFLNHGR